MLSVLNQRSDTHNSCEDSYYVTNNEFIMSGGVFDGCSTAIKSHWASQSLAYLFKKKYNPTLNSSVHQVYTEMSEIARMMQISAMNFLSTCILFVYAKPSKTLTIRIFGDGYYYINGEEHAVDQNNKPDYLGYQIFEQEGKSILDFLTKYPSITYHDVNDFKICSDGIKSIGLSQFHDSDLKPHEMLLAPPKSENYLERQWNILKKKHFTLSDDLTIISYQHDQI